MLDDARDPEVTELDQLTDGRGLELDPGAHEHDVLGLDVAMDDPEAMRLGERAARIGDDAERESLVQLADLAQRRTDGAAGDELEHEIVQPAIFVEVERVRDVRAADL